MGKHRQKILNQARMMLSERGLFDMNIRDLANACGLSVGTIYREVKNFDDVLVLMMANQLSEVDRVLSRANPQDLNTAEQLLFHMGFIPFSSQFKDYRLGMNFLPANNGLMNRASDEAVFSLRQEFKAIEQRLLSVVKIAKDQGDLLSSQEEIDSVLVDLRVICRGVFVLSLNSMYNKDLSVAKRLCSMSESMLSQLEWNLPKPLLDPRKLTIAWKTVLDQNFPLIVPDK